MALRFTPDGVVEAPTTLQIRVAPGGSSRLRVGAPQPSRALTTGEVLANVRHFRDPGPRSAPIERVVLSGLPEAWLAPGERLREIADHVVAVGIPRVVWHVDPVQLGMLQPLPEHCDLVVTSTAPSTLPPSGAPFSLTVPLTDDVMSRIDAVFAALLARPPSRVTLVWPFPDGTTARPWPAARVVEALATAVPALRPAPFDWGIKGLPRCVLQPMATFVGLEGRIWRTRNRYYVDADHQRGAALMFEPDLVRLVKSDGCRFCAVDSHCDGVAARWQAEGLVPPLTPLEST